MNQFNILSSELHLYINNYLPQPEKITDIDEQLTNLALVSKSFTPVYYKETVAKIPAIKNLFKNPLSENLSVGSITNAYREQIEPYLMNFNLSKKELARILDKLYIPIEEQIENLQSMNFPNKIELPNSNMSKYQVQRLIILSGSPLEKEQKEQLINIIDINDISKITSLADFCETKEGAEFLKTNFNILINIDINKLQNLSEFCNTKEGFEFLKTNFNVLINIDNNDKLQELYMITSKSEGYKCLVRNFERIINLDIDTLITLANFCLTKIGAKCLNTYFDRIIASPKIGSLADICHTEAGAEYLYTKFDECMDFSSEITEILANFYRSEEGVKFLQTFYQTHFDTLVIDFEKLKTLSRFCYHEEGGEYLNNNFNALINTDTAKLKEIIQAHGFDDYL